MKNGFFQLVKVVRGFGVKLVPPEDGGEQIRMAELINYLASLEERYDLDALKQAVLSGKETVFTLAALGDCPVRNEEYVVEIAPDNMQASVRFFPPSETGNRITMDEFIQDLRNKKVVWGTQMAVLQEHFMSEDDYCRDLIVAKGKEPRHGTDARIEYFFNTDVRIQPTMREDGSVDYFHLNVINHCRRGDMLARVIPEDEGEPGINVMGVRIKPRNVHKANLKYGNNIEASEDGMSIASMVDGHVMLVEDKVFVSDVYEVENVDLSTGNIDFEGSVEIKGNVASNMSINARGNVIVNGVVEGAYIEAGGNIIIARGMNGMTKGVLKAGGNIVAKFLENAEVEAGGYINTESILHSKVSAGTEITVEGRRGFITGGHVQAGEKITVKTLGAAMGAATVVEVGADPRVKAEYMQLQKDVSELVKEIKNIQPIIVNFQQKKGKGAHFNEEQIKYLKSNIELFETKKAELDKKTNTMKRMQNLLSTQNKAEVIVRGVVCAGTNVIIGDVSMVVQSSYEYCRFQRRDGEVKIAPLL
ncbi:MAG: FapA family protein [Roseburia sp.]|nr:FapA family protein [Roseburia sp.]